MSNNEYRRNEERISELTELFCDEPYSWIKYFISNLTVEEFTELYKEHKDSDDEEERI